jgi:hypothetical protein
MDNQNFMGLNNFVWWFGVVENRIDPLELGRCQVRCFGWHSESITQIPTEDLPWAHPILPIGTTMVKPPVEGTMVFGFFADGKEGRFPIIMGTVPGIPDEIRQFNSGFTDPYSEADKAANPNFPRKVKSSTVTTNASGPVISNFPPTRNPGNIDEPTTTRLTRPERIEDPETGSSLGVRTPSIANTAIDYQRKNRVVGIKTSDGYTWNEPFPSFNANFPFNNATETESGHAFELDDTPNWERVQLSHRTGSTLEFLPSGSVKTKSFNHNYDLAMSNRHEYTGGDHKQTVQGSMFLRINGKLIIECDGFDLVSSGDVNIKGKNVKITAGRNMDLYAGIVNKFYGEAGAEIRTEGSLFTYGGLSADHSSGGVTILSGVANPLSPAIKATLSAKLLSVGLTKSAENMLSLDSNILNSGVKVIGPNFWISTAITNMNSLLTNILPPVTFPDPSAKGSATAAARFRRAVPKLQATKPPPTREKTNVAGFTELQKVQLVNPDAVKNINTQAAEISLEKTINQEASGKERPLTPETPANDPAGATVQTP